MHVVIVRMPGSVFIPWSCVCLGAYSFRGHAYAWERIRSVVMRMPVAYARHAGGYASLTPG